MEEDGFEEWDADFIEKVELALATTQQQQQQRTDPPTTLPPQPQPQPQPPQWLGYAHGPALSITTHSPPRELSQRSVTTVECDRKKRTSGYTFSGAVSVPPVVERTFRTTADSSEILKLKRELERVSKQLSQRERECLELRKERERKEVQLQSATLPKEDRSSQAHCFRDVTVPSQECGGVSTRCLDPNGQETSRFGRGVSSYHTKGVQTDVENDDCSLPSDTGTTSCDSLFKKLKAIRRCSTEFYSGSYLASKLFTVCDTELRILFGYCKTADSSNPKEPVSVENRSLVTSVENGKFICSSDAAEVSRFYTAVTMMTSGMVQFETFYKALLDLCHIQNAVILYRSLRILHVVLLHCAGCPQPSIRRDYCAIEATNDVSALRGTDNIEITSLKHRAIDSLRASDIKPSCIDWLSLFLLMHKIINSFTDEPLLYEAICIMNVITKRFGPSDRERYGQIPVFQTVPKLLKKEAGLRVQKEAVHLLYLLVNCPAVLASLYCNFKESKPNSYGDSNSVAFEGLSTIFAGLEDCLICRGTVLESLELRRSAITLLSYLVSFGSSCHEVLWSSTACNKTGFLLLILRLLAFEIDSEALKPSELTDTVKERTLLVREALIFLNRIVSHSTFSGPAMRALTTSREAANLTVDTTSRLSRKPKNLWQDDGIVKQILETEIPNLARMLYKRVSAFLGSTISL